jgi:hypothetical protein
VALVSWVFEYLSITSLVICRFVSAAGLSGVGVRLWIPAYAIARVIVANFAPCRLNSLGLSRSRRYRFLYWLFLLLGHRFLRPLRRG